MAWQAKHGTVELEIRDGVAYVTLNRPKQRNAINGDMQWDLSTVWPAVNDDRSVQVVVVSGKGKDFSDANGETEAKVAVDPKSFGPARIFGHKPDPALEKQGVAMAMPTQGSWPGMRYVGLPDRTQGRPNKPMITAINGQCSGPGLLFVAFADIVIAADDAQFFSAQSNATSAPFEETVALIHLASLRAHEWLRMASMGDKYKVSAERARQLGMITEVVPGPQLIKRAGELGAKIQEGSPAAVRAAISAYWRTISIPYRDALMLAPVDGQQARLMDGKEGYLAWDEGRAPVFPSKTVFPWPPAWPPKLMLGEKK